MLLFSLLPLLIVSASPAVDVRKLSAQETANLGAGFDFNDPNHPCKSFCKNGEKFLSRLVYPGRLSAECFGNLPTTCLWNDSTVLQSLFPPDGSMDEEFSLDKDILSFAGKDQVEFVVYAIKNSYMNLIPGRYFINVGKNIPFGKDNGCAAVPPTWLKSTLISVNCLLSAKNWEVALSTLPEDRFKEALTKLVSSVESLGTLFIFNLTTRQTTILTSEFASLCPRMTLNQLQMLYIKDESFESSMCFLSLLPEIQQKLTGYWDLDYAEAETLLFGGVGKYNNKLKKLNVNVDDNASIIVFDTVLSNPGCDLIGDYSKVRSLKKFTPGHYKKVLIEHVGLHLEAETLPFYFSLLQNGGLFEWRSFRHMFRDRDHERRGKYLSDKARWRNVLYIPVSVKLQNGKIEVDQESLVRALKNDLISTLDSKEFFEKLYRTIYFNAEVFFAKMVEAQFTEITFGCPMKNDTQEAMVIEAKKP